jgi:hypothetical protein
MNDVIFNRGESGLRLWLVKIIFRIAGFFFLLAADLPAAFSTNKIQDYLFYQKLKRLESHKISGFT